MNELHAEIARILFWILVTIAVILTLSSCVNPGHRHQIEELREQIRTANEAILSIRERLIDVQTDLALYQSTPLECSCVGDEVFR